jgi:quercetin dioxygenase-like cupin family protein
MILGLLTLSFSGAVLLLDMLASRPFPDTQLLHKTAIPNCPGMTMIALQVSFSPNGFIPPHRHAGAFLVAHVISGYLFNKMNDDQMAIHRPGESFK